MSGLFLSSSKYSTALFRIENEADLFKYNCFDVSTTSVVALVEDDAPHAAGFSESTDPISINLSEDIALKLRDTPSISLYTLSFLSTSDAYNWGYTNIPDTYHKSPFSTV